MPLVLEIDESNQASETIEHGISEILAGSVDAFDLNPVSSPISPGDNSFEKWLRWHFTDLGGASAVGGLKFWCEAPPAETSLHFNGHTVQGSYEGANHRQTSYSEPDTANTRTPEDVPTSAPVSANIGIGGLLTGQLAAPGFSDYLLVQVRTTVDATVGDTLVASFGYEIIA